MGRDRPPRLLLLLPLCGEEFQSLSLPPRSPYCKLMASLLPVRGFHGFLALGSEWQGYFLVRCKATSQAVHVTKASSHCSGCECKHCWTHHSLGTVAFLAWGYPQAEWGAPGAGWWSTRDSKIPKKDGYMINTPPNPGPVPNTHKSSHKLNDCQGPCF